MKKVFKIILIVIGSIIALATIVDLFTSEEKKAEYEREMLLIDSLKIEEEKKLEYENERLQNPDIYWNDYSYEEKKAWIEKYIKDPYGDAFKLVTFSNNYLKSQFNYPSTVKMKYGGANFIDANVIEADSGWVFKTGTCSAKNAFGLELEYTFDILWKITPLELKILKLDINESF